MFGISNEVVKMTADEDHVAQVSNNLLTQFKAHHRIVIVSPLHNFNDLPNEGLYR